MWVVSCRYSGFTAEKNKQLNSWKQISRKKAKCLGPWFDLPWQEGNMAILAGCEVTPKNYKTRWWFRIFFMFTSTWGRFPC